MKGKLLASLLLLLLSADSVSRPDAHIDDEGYVLVFSDEFSLPDGSAPDTLIWSPCRRYGGQWSRWISDSPDVAFIRGGHLVCRAVPNVTVPEDTATMLTGAMETRGKFAFMYGKVEVRMRTNMKQGNFPAAWLVPTYEDGDTRYGEIDIVEMFGNQNASFHTIHNHRTFNLKRERPMSFKRKLSPDDWHVFGIIWTADEVAWTVDGDYVGSYRRIDTPQMKEEGQWTFDRPFYLRLNQSVGEGTYREMIPHTGETYETEFDWVRVYQKLTPSTAGGS